MSNVSMISEEFTVPLESTSGLNVSDGGASGGTVGTGSIESTFLKQSVENIPSDQWSNRGVSSKVSITIDTDDVTTYVSQKETQKKDDNCFTRCMKKLVGNILLPGLVGVYTYRQIDRLPHRHPISKQLITNALYYCSRVRTYLRFDLLPEIKSLATEIYFPTGQIEADGLSCISAEMWAATYLLLSMHRHVREADFHNLRSAYTSLVWDSAQTYRATLKFHRCLENFRSKILPLWFEIEEMTGLDLKNEFSAIDHPSRPLIKSPKRRKKYAKDGRPLSAPLSTVEVHDDFILQRTLSLQIIREKKSSNAQGKNMEQAFSELSYGKKIDVVKSILEKPMGALHSAPTVYRLIEPKLLSESLTRPDADPEMAAQKKALGNASLGDNDLTCSRALKILSATLKILLEEVDILPSIRSDIMDSVSSLGEELNDFLGYAEWVANKFSEFHSMLRLCYNFALLCFDMDLPSFESVVKQELAGEDVYAPGRDSASGMLVRCASLASNLEEDRLEYKVVSLTKLMMEASASFTSAHKQQVDDDFDWQDFYRTQYHAVLQRLPLRVGSHLLQFNSKPEVLLIVRRKVENAIPNDNNEDLQRFPGSFASIKKLHV